MRGSKTLTIIILALTLGLAGLASASAGPLSNAAARKLDAKSITSHALIQVDGWSGLGPLALGKVTVRALPPLPAPSPSRAAGAPLQGLDPLRAATILTIFAAILGATGLLWRTWVDIDAADPI